MAPELAVPDVVRRAIAVSAPARGRVSSRASASRPGSAAAGSPVSYGGGGGTPVSPARAGAASPTRGRASFGGASGTGAAQSDGGGGGGGDVVSALGVTEQDLEEARKNNLRVTLSGAGPTLGRFEGPTLVSDADGGPLADGAQRPGFGSVSMRGAAQSTSAATAAKGREAAERLRQLQEQRRAEAAASGGAGAGAGAGSFEAGGMGAGAGTLAGASGVPLAVQRAQRDPELEMGGESSSDDDDDDLRDGDVEPLSRDALKRDSQAARSMRSNKRRRARK